LQALDGGRLGCEDITPIGSTRQHAFCGPHCVIRRIDATGRATLLHRLDGLQEQAARLDDGFVSWPEMLSGAVHKASHAFLDGPVLRVHALNASKIPRFLCLAI